MSIDQSAGYTANIKTNKGDVLIQLFPAAAPKTVNNFVTLANDGFYDGVIFHRVILNFMIRGGDPTGTGTSGPGYIFEDEADPTLSFDKPGILAMSNSGPNTNGSQFFITTVPTPHLNGNHTIFGKVLEGQEVADTISTVPSGPCNIPIYSVVILGIKISRTEVESSLEIGTNGDSLEFSESMLSAASGSQVTLTFSNGSSVNQHNWVLVQTGTKDAVAAAGTGAGPGSGWIQSGDERVLASTGLLDPGATEQVSFTTPAPGTYQFVCTFPRQNFSMSGDFTIK